MKMFFMKAAKLTNVQSWAPRDILLNAQLRFLKKIFCIEGVKGKEVEVVVPKDGKPITFTCEVSTHERLRRVIDQITEADWGDFRITGLTVWNEDNKYDWLKVRFFVECTRSEIPVWVGEEIRP